MKAKEPSSGECKSPQKLGKMLSVTGFSHILNKAPKAKEVQDFLQQIVFQKCAPHEEGTTWLEMYILYKMREGGCIVEDPSNKASAKPSMRQLLCRDGVPGVG